jgi:RNA recognition motif-containing protein
MTQDDIYIGNLPQETKYDDIRKLFEIHGEISRIRMHKRFAFVSYSNKDIVETVIDVMSKTHTTLKIKPAKKRSGCIDFFVSFLALEQNIKVTEQSITVIFSEYGEIREVDIRKWVHHENTVCRGFGFVRYNDISNNKILQLQKFVVDDVEYNVSRSNRTPPTSPIYSYQEMMPIYYHDSYNPLVTYNINQNHNYTWTTTMRNLH